MLILYYLYIYIFFHIHIFNLVKKCVSKLLIKDYIYYILYDINIKIVNLYKVKKLYNII